ncbi:MAG: hypothetical protein H8Z69_04960 [Nanohaloarchaea archaeon]|nr:hypothetical protein [Candidatus Nanohaloarchaea archaeon]
MNNEQLILPISSVLGLLGVMTLLTNESMVGPVDIGFSMPYLVSADLQGFVLLIAGGLMTAYAITQMK